ncbi:hypothetical protein BgiMline_020943 [Biomphalaria glabrata]
MPNTCKIRGKKRKLLEEDCSNKPLNLRSKHVCNSSLKDSMSYGDNNTDGLNTDALNEDTNSEGNVNAHEKCEQEISDPRMIDKNENTLSSYEPLTQGTQTFSKTVILKNNDEKLAINNSTTIVIHNVINDMLSADEITNCIERIANIGDNKMNDLDQLKVNLSTECEDDKVKVTKDFCQQSANVLLVKEFLPLISAVTTISEDNGNKLCPLENLENVTENVIDATKVNITTDIKTTPEIFHASNVYDLNLTLTSGISQQIHDETISSIVHPDNDINQTLHLDLIKENMSKEDAISEVNSDCCHTLDSLVQNPVHSNNPTCDTVHIANESTKEMNVSSQSIEGIDNNRSVDDGHSNKIYEHVQTSELLTYASSSKDNQNNNAYAAISDQHLIELVQLSNRSMNDKYNKKQLCDETIPNNDLNHLNKNESTYSHDNTSCCQQTTDVQVVTDSITDAGDALIARCPYATEKIQTNTCPPHDITNTMEPVYPKTPNTQATLSSCKVLEDAHKPNTNSEVEQRTSTIDDLHNFQCSLPNSDSQIEQTFTEHSKHCNSDILTSPTPEIQSLNWPNVNDLNQKTSQQNCNTDRTKVKSGDYCTPVACVQPPKQIFPASNESIKSGLSDSQMCQMPTQNFIDTFEIDTPGADDIEVSEFEHSFSNAQRHTREVIAKKKSEGTRLATLDITKQNICL